jgi:hypothetical protein
MEKLKKNLKLRSKSKEGTSMKLADLVNLILTIEDLVIYKNDKNVKKKVYEGTKGNIPSEYLQCEVSYITVCLMGIFSISLKDDASDHA